MGGKWCRIPGLVSWLEPRQRAGAVPPSHPVVNRLQPERQAGLQGTGQSRPGKRPLCSSGSASYVAFCNVERSTEVHLAPGEQVCFWAGPRCAGRGTEPRVCIQRDLPASTEHMLSPSTECPILQALRRHPSGLGASGSHPSGEIGASPCRRCPFQSRPLFQRRRVLPAALCHWFLAMAQLSCRDTVYMVLPTLDCIGCVCFM